MPDNDETPACKPILSFINVFLAVAAGCTAAYCIHYSELFARRKAQLVAQLLLALKFTDLLNVCTG